MSPAQQRGLLGVLLVLGAALGGRAAWLAREASLGPESVVLVILDTVRADHTSLCGYARPTTPRLDKLAAEGAAYTCGAVSPASWTLPSHASFFTGVPPLQHGAHELPLPTDGEAHGVLMPGTAVHTLPLDGELPTLAEQLAARGYQTRLVSANPVLAPASGLTRGFGEPVIVAPNFHGVDPVAGVETALRSLDPDGGPLFLVVNIVAAHQPWDAVPAGLDWLPERPELLYRAGRPDDVWTRWYKQELSPEERTAFLAHLTDVYDYGVRRADDQLGGVLDLLEQRGWCLGRCRLVVTSDHGELLGEGGLIDHGFTTAEANARVPVLARGLPTLSLPALLSATHVFHLLRDGALPATLLPVEQPAWAHPNRYLASGGAFYGSVFAARWEEGAQKRTWRDGVYSSVDLRRDPLEASPTPWEPDAEMTRFVSQVSAVRAEDVTVSDEVLEMLKAAGYVEE